MIASVADTFAEFTAWLTKERAGYVELIGRLENGFEGWLKIELYRWLVGKGLDSKEDVGVEYKVPLDRRWREVDRETKCCDLWLRANRDDRYHYVELKAPFANGNAGKVLTGAGYDLWYVSRLHRLANAASGNLIVLGVGFDTDDAWRKAGEKICTAAELAPGFAAVGHGELSDRVRWAVWTHHYV